MRQNKCLISGILSCAIGMLNILISALMFWALWSLVNNKFFELLFWQFKILNLGSKVELITEPLGIILGIYGLVQRGRYKQYAIIGTSINLIVVLWTLAILSGFII